MAIGLNGLNSIYEKKERYVSHLFYCPACAYLRLRIYRFEIEIRAVLQARYFLAHVCVCVCVLVMKQRARVWTLNSASGIPASA